MSAKIKTLQPNERQFQTFFKSVYNGWLTQIHPGLGSDVGVPDLFVLQPSGLLPVELKIGSIDENNVLWTKEIRPAQIRWHTELANAGGASMILVGVWNTSPCHENGRWRVFAIDPTLSSQWDTEGFPCGSVAKEIDPDNLYQGLADFCFDELGV